MGTECWWATFWGARGSFWVVCGGEHVVPCERSQVGTFHVSESSRFAGGYGACTTCATRQTTSRSCSDHPCRHPLMCRRSGDSKNSGSDDAGKGVYQRRAFLFLTAAAAAGERNGGGFRRRHRPARPDPARTAAPGCPCSSAMPTTESTGASLPTCMASQPRAYANTEAAHRHKCRRT